MSDGIVHTFEWRRIVASMSVPFNSLTHTGAVNNTHESASKNKSDLELVIFKMSKKNCRSHIFPREVKDAPFSQRRQNFAPARPSVRPEEF